MTKIYGRVYKITNLVNGKQYVGRTTNTIKYRFNKHCNAKNTYITRAINKYGKANFKIEEISVAYTQEQLDFSEGFYINSFKTLAPNGYNVTNIINGVGKHSEETKEKMRIAQNKPEKLKWFSNNGKKNRGTPIKNSTSKYCGVNTQNNKYITKICFNNKPIYLGIYNLETDAAKAYDIAAIKHFGKDAKLNFPELRQDYINNKIILKKHYRQDNSKSGIKGIRFHEPRNRWIVIYFDKILDKERSKYFKTLEEAINFKTSLKD